MEIIPKGWGFEIVLCNYPGNRENYAAKLLFLVPHAKTSLHLHQEKHETFVILRGTCIVKVDKRPFIMPFSDFVRVNPYERHLIVTGDKAALLLEISTHDSPQDTTRLKNGDSQNKPKEKWPRTHALAKTASAVARSLFDTNDLQRIGQIVAGTVPSCSIEEGQVS